MRIVGGSLRGRRLAAPKGNAVRPTTDRTRETLFNILRNLDAVEGAFVLDAFCGTGALALEALSRGAARATLLDRAQASLALARANVAALGQDASTTILRADATRPPPLRGEPHDLVLLDPPYGRGLGDRALTALADAGWIAPGATVVLEERTDAPAATSVRFRTDDRRRLGETTLTFFTFLDKDAEDERIVASDEKLRSSPSSHTPSAPR